MSTPPRQRLRDLGITIGNLPTGPDNAITDVAGVRVGHTTLIQGSGPLVPGQGPIRTGVTVIMPRSEADSAEPCYAGFHILNGNGEMTGLPWIEESGLLTTPVAITNTASVGVVRDAIVAAQSAANSDTDYDWYLPVVAETFDGRLNDILGMHVTRDHVLAAIASAASGPIAEGNVGGGTGMICHGFKGGIGTSSRVLPEHGGYMVGVLVQANHGSRRRLQINGVPIIAHIPPNRVPLPGPPSAPTADTGSGSIIVVVATDAPLLPHQCRRLARRASLGIGRLGGLGEDSSGDILLAFSTANRGLAPNNKEPAPISVQTLASAALNPLFEAVVEATEEAIVNAMTMAQTMDGADGFLVHAIPLDLLQEALASH